MSHAIIVDFGMGNLFSVARACEVVGLPARISSDPAEIRRAGAIILPGVGAFADAMSRLRSLRLVEALRDSVSVGRPLLGVCLGMQLLMDSSEEFGLHEGLGLVPGEVVALPRVSGCKIPQMGWNRVWRSNPTAWDETPLKELRDGEYQYFIHSFVVRPIEPADIIATTDYSGAVFCSGLRSRNIMGVQFHPERSGPEGLRVYSAFAQAVMSERISGDRA